MTSERSRPLPPGVVPATPAAGQESVWDYPRPPFLLPDPRPVRIEHGGGVIAETASAWRVLETGHPPTWYVPASAFAPGALRAVAGAGSVCEWKGRARYLSLVGPDGRVAERAAWSYPTPTEAFAAIADHVALYAGRVDAVWVADARVTPQPGAFYGGWITPDVVGPFKGGPGSEGW